MMTTHTHTDSLTADPVTVEVMAFAPVIRDDLRITRQLHSGQTSFLIEDPTSGRFSRVGLAEYTFLSLLDGRTTVAEALARTASKHGLDALEEADAVSLTGWLVESGLAHTRASRSGGRVGDDASKQRGREIAGAVNPMFQKLPLGSPAFLLDPIVRVLKAIFQTPIMRTIGLIAAVLWAIASVVVLVSHSGEFWDSSRSVFSAGNWIWLIVTWLVVKGAHEAGHAIACRMLGGRVGQTGIMFVLFMPLPYVEVTSSWAFQNKWHRILVAAAGMMVEAVLASAAFWVWVHCSNPLVQMHAQNLIVTATITTVLFNLNPLMRFDGYYMLSDYLELPNLSTNATRWLTYVRQKYWFGASVSRPTWPEGKVAIVAVYAIAAFVWRVLICVSLAVAAMSMFWGAGVVLAIVAAGIWIGRPVSRFITDWKNPVRIDRKRFLGVTGIALVTAAAILMTPYQRSVWAPVVVKLDDPVEVRSSVRGFVAEIVAQPGDQIQPGDVLARLENKELQIDLRKLASEIKQSQHRQRVYRREQSMVELEIERASEMAMVARYEDLQQRKHSLVIRSDCSGSVIQSSLVDRIGTLVTTGESLFVIAKTDQLKLVAMIGQDDAVTLRHRDQFVAELWIDGHGRMLPNIEFHDLKPRATRNLAHPALASPIGGALAVYPNPQAESINDRWKLVDPRVVAETTLPNHLAVTHLAANHLAGDRSLPDQPNLLRSGQTGTVQFVLDRRSIGSIWLDRWNQWYRQAGTVMPVAAR